MDSQPQISKPASPTELLSTQASALVELVEIQKDQKVQIEELQRQNERLIGLLAQDKKETSLAHVKIEDVNVPFMALVGFLVKVSLASIPAMIIMALIYGVIAGIISVVFGVALGGILGR